MSAIPVPQNSILNGSEAQWQLEGLLGPSPIASCLVDMEGCLVYANEALRRLIGSEKLVGEQALTLFEENDRPGIAATLLKLVGRAEQQAQLSVVLNGGEHRRANVFLSETGGQTAKPVFLLQVLLVEPQANAEERRWGVALESAGQGVWDHDLARGTAYYSPGWYRMRGFADGDDIDAELGSWFDRLHPDDRDAIITTTRRQNSGEIPHNDFEYRERHRDGSWIWILSRGKPIKRNPDGSVARIIGTDTDITQLKMIEAQLAAEKERLKVTLQSIADGMISTDAQGNITLINAAAVQLTGWPLEEAIGRPVEDIFKLKYEATGETAPTSVRECLAQGKSIAVDDDLIVVTKGGFSFEVQHTASPVKTATGEVVGAVLVFQDVSHSRALKRELAHSAMHDGLTGLPNRTAFNKAIEECAEIARREFRHHALCYIDLDFFKAVNDGAGHAAGDDVLKAVAGLIRRSCRASDFAGRLGGDEFIVLLTDCPLPNAEKLCQKIVDQIAARVFEFGGKQYRIGASIGITAITPKRPSALELTSEADAACYVAKSEGRGRVAVFPSD